MKGIAHFISGVAVASFCPWAVAAAQEGNPAYFIIGAAAGILPDTIDFKFYRFFFHHDLRVEPYFGRPSMGGVVEGRGVLILFDADKLDPQPIADAVAKAVSLAMEGMPTTLKLSTIKMGADNWRQYCVKIDPEAGEVRVQFGPIVSTGQVPQPDTLPEPRPVGVARFNAPILQNYESTYTVDIFDGPSFAFEKRRAPRQVLDIRYWLFGKTKQKHPGAVLQPSKQTSIANNPLLEKGAVEIDFLPWHRSWSHSLIVGLALAGIASIWTWKAGVIIFGAYMIHVLEDQLGYMGSNFFFPFAGRRVPGLKLMRSTDAFPNFAAVWLCCLLIFWNLYAAIDSPLYHFSFFRLILTAMIVPFAAFGALHWLLVRAVGGEPETLTAEWNI